MRELRSRYLETRKIEWRLIEDFQPEGFKTMSKAAARRYLESVDLLDLIRNFKVFELEGRIFHIDGHHLAKILKLAEEEKRFTVPDFLPADFYRIEDFGLAARIVLAHSSTFARVQYEGLDELATMHDILIDEAKSFAEIPSVTWAYWDEIEPPSTDETDDEGRLEDQTKPPDLRYKIKKPKIAFPVEAHEYSILLSALRRIKAKRDLGSLTDVLKHLISYEEEVDLNESDVL